MNRAPSRRLRTPLPLLLTAVLLASPAGAQHFPADDDLRLMLRYIVEDGETPGVVLGVLEADGTTRAVGYGSAGPGAAPPGPRWVFEIGSLTMTFTAALLADMVARGEVSLDDPVARYLPGTVTLPSPGGYRITLGDLATHRSGLPADPEDAHAGITTDHLYELVARAELERSGRRYAFSHLGYALLGHALARAAEQSYPELLRERVLDPLGMRMTGYTPDRAAGERMARGHAGGRVVPHAVVADAMHGATGLRSTAEDMLRFLRANAAPPGTDLERAMRMAHEIRVERGGPDRDAGYGFSWRTYVVGSAPSLVAHGGGTDGFTAQIHFDPERGIGTVLLANTRGFSDRIARSLLLFDPPASSPASSPAAAHADPAGLGRYEGTYRSTIGRYMATLNRGRYFIRLEDEGYLTYQSRGVVRTRLYAESDSSFYMLRGPYTVTFAGQGDALGMVIRVDDRKQYGRARSWTAWRVDAATPAPAVVAGNVARWRTWGALTWAIIALLGVAAAAGIARSLRSRGLGGRAGTGRVRSRAAWSSPGQYP